MSGYACGAGPVRVGARTARRPGRMPSRPGLTLSSESGDVKPARNRIALRDSEEGRANGVRASEALDGSAGHASRLGF